MAVTDQRDTFYAGNVRTYPFSVDDENNPGNKLDLTGMTVAFALSKYLSASAWSKTPLVEKSIGDGITITNASQGALTVTLSPDDTASLEGEFYFELEVTDASANPVVVATGRITLLRNVTNA